MIEDFLRPQLEQVDRDYYSYINRRLTSLNSDTSWSFRSYDLKEKINFVGYSCKIKPIEQMNIK